MWGIGSQFVSIEFCGKKNGGVEKVFGVKPGFHFIDTEYLASYFITVILTFF